MAKIPSRVGSAGTGDGPRRSARQARATQRKAQARKAVNTSARRSGLAPQHPEIREALFRSFQNRTSPADTPHQKGSSLPAHLDRARRQIPELTAEQPGGANTSPHHSQSRSRSSFPSRSGERSVTGPRPHEHDTDIEMTPADSLPLDSGRASSLEIISEGEYRVALESRQSLQIGERMTFKKEPEDANYGLGPGLRLSNVGGFLRSIGLDHLIPAFHNVGLKTQDHLRKLIENVKDQARMEELRRLLPTKTVSLPVWWDIQDALMKEADNVHK
ncbi:hypothetical protein DXG01_009921 [Tephrocybe rancida]|nr:hypothetical protein DXG01_009921 [Tephrocybe rancida]